MDTTTMGELKSAVGPAAFIMIVALLAALGYVERQRLRLATRLDEEHEKRLADQKAATAVLLKVTERYQELFGALRDKISRRPPPSLHD